MTNFDKTYYDEIWGTVHRHEYCENLANELIAKYGQVKILDIGTGCGFLVKTLREKGCDAWGLEISDYAVANSCDPEHVRKGDVRDIPYASGFDVVFSQGLWSYLPKQDIQKAWKECKRVGKKQWHKIDTTQCEYHDYFLTYESQEWWDNQFYPKLLVACPIHEAKGYSIEGWINQIHDLTYPNFDALMVDNSPNLDFFNQWKDKVPMIHLDTGEQNSDFELARRINTAKAYEKIRQVFLAGNYERLFIYDSDIRGPKDIIEILLDYGREADWIAHSVPSHDDDKHLTDGFSPAILSRKIMENPITPPPDQHPDGWFWINIVSPNPEYKTYEFWNLMKLEHLDK